MNRHGALRASDADRDHVVNRLQRAATEGRIASEELETRVTDALRARTYSELDATLADLPGPRARPRDPARAGHDRGRTAGAYAVRTVRRHPAVLLFAIPVLAVTFAMLIAATVLWAVLMTVVLVLGGRRPGPPPLRYGQRAVHGYSRALRGVPGAAHPARGHARAGGRGLGPGGRWA